jgi:hypothetical protein
MDDDEPKPEKHYPISTAKMSKTPSWIMLGFLLGAAFVIALPPLRKQPALEATTLKAVPPPQPTEPRQPPQLTTIEAVFAEWGEHAVWSNDVAEVALWNTQDKAYTDFYEVRRIGDAFYFRTIPRLTRRIVSRGKPLPNSPLLFTETEEQYREWRTYGRSERPMDRETSTRPRNVAPPPAPAPVDRSINLVAPALPPPELPSPSNPGKK